MRYLRVVTVIFLIFSIIFTAWANLRFLGNINNDYPVINSDSQLIEISVEDGKDALLKGLSASDKTDGDLTADIMVASTSHFLKLGTVNVKYVVFDSDNNSATLTRKVHYKDYKSPEFSLEKAPVYTKGDSFDLLDYVKVTDVIDGDISDRVRIITNMVSNYSSGVYPVTLEVSNSYGDTARLDLFVTYLDDRSNVTIQLKKYVVYLEQNEEFEPFDWIASVMGKDNTFLDKEDVTVQGNLDTGKEGYYQLIYSYSKGDNAGQSCITVVVKGAVNNE